MRLSRHAKNRLRWLRRSLPNISEQGILETLEFGVTLGSDPGGNRKVALSLGYADLVIVVDDSRGIVITIWREG